MGIGSNRFNVLDLTGAREQDVKLRRETDNQGFEQSRLRAQPFQKLEDAPIFRDLYGRVTSWRLVWKSDEKERQGSIGDVSSGYRRYSCE